MWAEVEFEDGGKEVRVGSRADRSAASSTFNPRGGMLLVPLGRFNLAHDAPRNEFTDRPLIATDLLGTALAMPGFGAYGRFATGYAARATYELYAVNGYDSGILDLSPDGTRLTEGADNLEDHNASPAWVARLAWLPPSITRSASRATPVLTTRSASRGSTWTSGATSRSGRSMSRTHFAGLEWSGEAAIVEVDIPRLGGVVREPAGRDSSSRPAACSGAAGFARCRPPSFSAAVRAEGVDFDRDLEGDSRIQLTTGVHFRPDDRNRAQAD